MKVIILEGIATSGKTSVKNKLVEILAARQENFSIINEEESLLPILNNTDRKISIALLKKIISEALNSDKKIIIFDRLFFTHIFKTGSSVEEFKEIENMLVSCSLLVFLKIDESKIPERIERARQHREKEWVEYVNKKGNNEEIFQYYINQQRLLLELINQTSLNYKIYDTTDMDFDDIANDILKTIQ
jgi:thymidylate kinase